MDDLKNEKTFILIEVTGKNITRVKEEIIKAALKRKDYGDTTMTVNLPLDEIYITTTSENFLKHIFSNKDFLIKTRISRVSAFFKRKFKSGKKK